MIHCRGHGRWALHMHTQRHSLSLLTTIEKPSSLYLHFRWGKDIFSLFSANDSCRRLPGSIAGLLRVSIYNSVTYKDTMLTFEQWNLPVHLFEYYKPEAHGQLCSCFQLLGACRLRMTNDITGIESQQFQQALTTDLIRLIPNGYSVQSSAIKSCVCCRS